MNWDSVEQHETTDTSQTKIKPEETKEPKKRKRKRRKKKKTEGGDDPEFDTILREFEKNIQVKNGQKPPSCRKIKPNLDSVWIEGLSVLSKQLSQDIQNFQNADEMADCEEDDQE